MKELKDDIIWRVYLVYILMCLFGVIIIGKVVVLQFVEGEEWKKKAQTLTTAYRNIDAVRGNIFAADGSLLATSVPIYEIRMDVNADPITDKIFNKNVDSLAYHLSMLFKDKTPSEYVKQLKRARKKGERYHFIKNDVRYNELKHLRTFPLFRMGKYKGGLIYIQKNKREFPFRTLAARTLGYEREGIKPVGIEGAYNNYLKGTGGKRLMQKIAGNVWMPINNENEIDPTDGSDLITTIDVNIQDVAHDALLTQLTRHNADHGCLALMEVQTGEVKAIVNLTRKDSGLYSESYNYIIGESTEPGSTFKLASLMVAMEDGYADLNDTVDTEGGKKKYYDRVMNDSHEGGYGKITLQRSFELSSNVAVSKIITRYYSKDPQRFVDRLYKMNLNSPLGLDISGEGLPKIKTPKDKSWSGVTLPWMSIGYETRLTPLQILSFYNAVANDGKLVRPLFVKQIKKRGAVEKAFEPVVLNESICSKETIKQAKKMLEGVVEKGTAVNLKNANYKIAGKTGTAQIANDKYGYKSNAKVSYQASFVGYFPADNPKYSCIVVVNAPSNNVYYGNAVAGPIFKEVADKVYSTSINIHQQIISDTSNVLKIPFVKGGSKSEIETVADALAIPLKTKGKGEYAKAYTSASRIELKEEKISRGVVPNVIGMSVKDALFILENEGLQVKVSGRGAVTRQFPAAGSKVNKGSAITIESV